MISPKVSKVNYSTTLLPNIGEALYNKTYSSHKKLKTTTLLPTLITESIDRIENNETEVSTKFKSSKREFKKSHSPPKNYHKFTPDYKNNKALQAVYKESNEIAEKIKKIKKANPNNLEEYHDNIIENLFGKVSQENLSKLASSLKNVRNVNKMDIKTAKKVEKIEESNKVVFPGISLKMMKVRMDNSNYSRF